MSENVINLVGAIVSGDALETENAFNAAMAEKLVSKLDDMRTNISQNMFRGSSEDTEVDMNPPEELEPDFEEVIKGTDEVEQEYQTENN